MVVDRGDATVERARVAVWPPKPRANAELGGATMKDQSHLFQNVEQVFNEFFETGRSEGKVHTLHLAGATSDKDRSAIKTALSRVAGVEGVHVGEDPSSVHVLWSGTPEPLVEALEDAGYEVKALY